MLYLAAGFASAQGTLSLSNPGSVPAGGYPAGSAVALNVGKSGNATVTGLQFDIAATSGTMAIAASPAAILAGKTLSCSGSFPIRCLLVGLANTTLIPDGVVAIATETLGSSGNPVTVTVSLPVETDSSGNGVAVTVGNPTVSLPLRSGCDVNGDGSVSSADTQAVVNSAIARSTSAVTDLDSNGATDVRDAQIASTGATGPAFVCNAR